MFTHTHACKCTHKYANTYTCMHAHTHACTNTHTYIYIHTHTQHTHLQWIQWRANDVNPQRSQLSTKLWLRAQKLQQKYSKHIYCINMITAGQKLTILQQNHLTLFFIFTFTFTTRWKSWPRWCLAFTVFPVGWQAVFSNYALSVAFFQKVVYFSHSFFLLVWANSLGDWNDLCIVCLKTSPHLKWKQHNMTQGQGKDKCGEHCIIILSII